jgi:hypothetical protein
MPARSMSRSTGWADGEGRDVVAEGDDWELRSADDTDDEANSFGSDVFIETFSGIGETLVCGEFINSCQVKPKRTSASSAIQ